MKIGIIGAGQMAQAFGCLAVKAGHQIKMSNSRGPESIIDLREKFGYDVGSVDEAAAFGEIIFAAIPLQAYSAIPMESLWENPRVDRRALPIAGDSEDAKELAINLLDQIGYDAVDAGPLAEGWRFERWKPVYCVPLNKKYVRTNAVNDNSR